MADKTININSEKIAEDIQFNLNITQEQIAGEEIVITIAGFENFYAKDVQILGLQNYEATISFNQTGDFLVANEFGGYTPKEFQFKDKNLTDEENSDKYPPENEYPNEKYFNSPGSTTTLKVTIKKEAIQAGSISIILKDSKFFFDGLPYENADEGVELNIQINEEYYKNLTYNIAVNDKSKHLVTLTPSIKNEKGKSNYVYRYDEGSDAILNTLAVAFSNQGDKDIRFYNENTPATITAWYFVNDQSDTEAYYSSVALVDKTNAEYPSKFIVSNEPGSLATPPITNNSRVGAKVTVEDTSVIMTLGETGNLADQEKAKNYLNTLSLLAYTGEDASREEARGFEINNLKTTLPANTARLYFIFKGFQVKTEEEVEEEVEVETDVGTVTKKVTKKVIKWVDCLDTFTSIAVEIKEYDDLRPLYLIYDEENSIPYNYSNPGFKERVTVKPNLNFKEQKSLKNKLLFQLQFGEISGLRYDIKKDDRLDISITNITKILNKNDVNIISDNSAIDRNSFFTIDDLKCENQELRFYLKFKDSYRINKSSKLYLEINNLEFQTGFSEAKASVKYERDEKIVFPDANETYYSKRCDLMKDVITTSFYYDEEETYIGGGHIVKNIIKDLYFQFNLFDIKEVIQNYYLIKKEDTITFKVTQKGTANKAIFSKASVQVFVYGDPNYIVEINDESKSELKIKFKDEVKLTKDNDSFNTGYPIRLTISDFYFDNPLLNTPYEIEILFHETVKEKGEEKGEEKLLLKKIITPDYNENQEYKIPSTVRASEKDNPIDLQFYLNHKILEGNAKFEIYINDDFHEAFEGNVSYQKPIEYNLNEFPSYSDKQNNILKIFCEGKKYLEHKADDFSRLSSIFIKFIEPNSKK